MFKSQLELKNYLIKRGFLKSRIFKEAFTKVDRKDFVPKEYSYLAYEDFPLPIGFGQTISQPSTVAFMLQELELKKDDKVLEVGTGSGWNAALISHIIGEKGKIYSIEIFKELAEKVKEKLKNYKNIIVLNENASHGLAKYAPYNKIILTAAPKELSKEFKEQLADGGILLAPVGEYVQKLIKLEKKKDRFIETEKGDFVFVPLLF
ncbi:MAG: protein-L-isoaspartate(D-aspartate) O-methyltransferase [Candidatus Paceibacterota bacterium]|jgi:protein-L-isoaspartate(D-aspartate) O-methyltransferase